MRGDQSARRRRVVWTVEASLDRLTAVEIAVRNRRMAYHEKLLKRLFQ